MRDDILFGFFMYGAGLLASGFAINISLEIVRPILIPLGSIIMVLMVGFLLIKKDAKRRKRE